MSEITSPDPLDLYRFYRGKVEHEGQLMLSRLTALLASQSFLMLAYASSMVSSHGRWHEPFTLLLPPVLALLGGVLALEGRAGITAAQRKGARWATRADALLAEHGGLAIWTDGSDPAWAASTRRAGDLFASRSPLIFLAAWGWFLLLPFGFYLRG